MKLINSIFILITVFTLSTTISHSFEFGIGLHVRDNQSKFDQVYPAIKDAGFSSFRDEIYMSRVELSKGFYSMPMGLADLDQLINKSYQDGIKPLIVLDYGNKFYDDGDIITSDEGREAFAKYVTFVVKKYQSKVSMFEVWNEYNIGMGSNKKPRTLGTPENYVKLLEITYKTIKKINPKLTVVAGGVEGLDDKWIDQFIKLGGLRFTDIFSVHPYVLQHGPDPRPESSINWVDQCIAKVNLASPNKKIPFYITEIGWPTNIGKYGVTENQQSDYFLRFNLLAASRALINGVWWYTLIDGGSNPFERENRFGILRTNLTPKPGFSDAQKIASILKNYKLTELAYNGEANIRIVSAEKNGKFIYFVWNDKLDDSFKEISANKLISSTTNANIDLKDLTLSLTSRPIRLSVNSGAWVVDNF